MGHYFDLLTNTRTALAASIACLIAFAAPIAVALDTPPLLFSQAQAERGAELYQKECAACHGENLEGGRQSALTGQAFMEKWAQGNRAVEDFYQIIKTQMPYGRADSLSPQQYIDIVAHVLSANGYQTGPQDLQANSAVLSTKIVRQAESGAVAKKVARVEAPVFISDGHKATTTLPTQAELNSAYANTAEWLHSNHDYRGHRFVDIKQINRDNVKSLRPVAMYQAADNSAFHTNPLVHAGMLYITTTTSTIAIDAVTAKQIWRFDRKPRADVGWPQTRGAAIKEGKIIRATTDGYLVALDAKTGKPLWERRVGDRRKNEGGFTMAPVIWEDLILIGPAGSELGVKGWFGAFRLDNGEPVWRFNTIPDDNEPGADTWGTKEARRTGGGAVWAPLSFDYEKGLVYVPVANPYPDYQDETRQGKNLYTNSMVVLDARTGKLKWFYQSTPHDMHDWDLTQVSPLFEAKIKGKMRKLVAVTGKDAMLHVLDRETKEHLYEVALAPRENTDVIAPPEGVHVCPGVLGGVEWNGPAFNPGTNMLYVPLVDWCSNYSKIVPKNEAERYLGGRNIWDPVEKSKGLVTAVDASTGKITWQYRSERPMLAAITATSADLLFTGELTGHLIVLDARSGEKLYTFNVGGPVTGGVITYQINGKQYVAVASGNATPFWQALPASAQIVIFALP